MKLDESNAGYPALPQYLQPPLPTVFTLEITQRCQHNCVGCGNVFPHGPQDMEAAAWDAILACLRPHIKALRITGGEPTLHPQFDQIMASVTALGVPFGVFTNGDWSAPQTTLEILKQSKLLRQQEKGCGLLISLHGADPESYAAFVGVDAFARVLQNIKTALDAGLCVATNTLLLTSTFHRIPEIVEQLSSLGVHSIAFGRYYGKPLPELCLTDAQLRFGLSEIAKARSQNPRVILSNCIPTCFFPELDVGGRGCTSGLTHCTIGPMGEVRPCTHTDLVLGNIHTQNLEALWKSSKLHHWRQRIPIACRQCAALSQCKGGCRATADTLGLSQDPLMCGPLADLKFSPTITLHLEDHVQFEDSVEIVCLTDHCALTGTGRYVPLAAESEALLQTLASHPTIAQVHDQFGQAAVQVVGSLLHHGLLEIVEGK